MEAERIQVLKANGTTNVWTPVSSSMVNELPASDCFNDTNGVSPFQQYAYGVAGNGYFWQVASF